MTVNGVTFYGAANAAGMGLSAGILLTGHAVGGVIGNLTLPNTNSATANAALVLSTAHFGAANGTAGTLSLPPDSDVLSGVGYGGNGNSLTGNVTLPPYNQVMAGTTYGVSGNSISGMLVLPASDTVEGGQPYGDFLDLIQGTLRCPDSATFLRATSTAATGMRRRGYSSCRRAIPCFPACNTASTAII